MRGVGTAGLALALAGATAGAARADFTVGLPSPTQLLTASPPLSGAAGATELRLPGRVSSRQRVLVGIGLDGRPVSLQADQRLVLEGKGDYSFIVPAPLTDVLPGAGTDSQPGFRKDAIVWQGFSPGRRVLAARAKLRVADAAPSLPVRLSLRTTVGGRELRAGERRTGPLAVELTLRNVTAAPDVTFGAVGVPIELARVLDSLRRTIESGRPYASYAATVRSKPDPFTRRYEAALAVRGEIRFAQGRASRLQVSGGRAAPGRVSFTVRLGEDAPLRHTVRISGRASALGAPQVELRVEPDLLLHSLRPPRGRTWTDAVRRRLVPLDGRAFLRTTIDTLLRLSRTRQYETYLANPDLLVRAAGDRTVYVFRTVAAARPVPAPPSSGGGGGVLVPVLLAVGGVVVAGALVVLWAHA